MTAASSEAGPGPGPGTSSLQMDSLYLFNIFVLLDSFICRRTEAV